MAKSPQKVQSSDEAVAALGDINDNVAMLRTLSKAMDNERTATELITLDVIIDRMTRACNRLDAAIR